MISNSFALFNNILLAVAALAVQVPSPQPEALSVRLRENHLSRTIQGAESHAVISTRDSNIEYTTNLGGAAWNEPDETFTSVAGTFAVPTLSSTLIQGIVGFGGAIWVGIDKVPSCPSGALRAGVTFRIVRGLEVTYEAWYQWIPEPRQPVDLDIKAGDIITISITVGSDPKSAAMVIQNRTINKSVTRIISTSFALCKARVQWIYEISLLRTFLGTKVTFTDATATSGLGHITYYTPSGATVVSAKVQGGTRDLTSVDITGRDIIIKQIN